MTEFKNNIAVLEAVAGGFVDDIPALNKSSANDSLINSSLELCAEGFPILNDRVESSTEVKENTKTGFGKKLKTGLVFVFSSVAFVGALSGAGLGMSEALYGKQRDKCPSAVANTDAPASQMIRVGDGKGFYYTCRAGTKPARDYLPKAH